MKSRTMVRCGCCAALMTLCAWMSVTVGQMAFTMQTFGVFLTVLLLGGGSGTAACCVYLLLGALGLPVFSGFQGGIGVLLGPTGGYLFGFVLLGLCYLGFKNSLGEFWALLLGLLICYGCGTAWFYFLYGGSWKIVLLKCVLPYLLPDGCKLFLAMSVQKRLRK